MFGHPLPWTNQLLPYLLAVFAVSASATVEVRGAIPRATMTLDQLINLPGADLAEIDIASMNLAAAEGLPGSTAIDQDAILQTLDQWARAVGDVTAGRLEYFEENAIQFDHSFARFCAHDLLMTLNVQLGVHYNLAQRSEPSLAHSQDQFIHGLAMGTGGTCASLPVVFVAVGRRLGYPLRLAQAKSHYYVRWDDPVTGERFNIEGSGDGFAFYDDKHYESWPHALDAQELERGNYLQSLSAREELSVFLTTRGDCLRENGDIGGALHAYAQAVRLAPKNLFAAGLLHDTRIRLQRELAELEAAWEAQEARQRDPRFAVPGLPEMPIAHPASERPPVHAPILPFPSQSILRIGPSIPPFSISVSDEGKAVPGSHSVGREAFGAMKRRNGVR